MKHTFWTAGILLAALVSGPAATNDLTAQLQQGLFDEEANQDLNAAITDYQALAKQFDQNRTIAATAIYRLGECYRKLGQTNEAAGAYQRLLRDFPEETKLVTLSREDLAGMGVVTDKVAGPGESLDLLTTDHQLAVYQSQIAALEQDNPQSVRIFAQQNFANPVLTDLMQKLDAVELEYAKTTNYYGLKNVAVTDLTSQINFLNRQIDGQVAGIRQEILRKLAVAKENSQQLHGQTGTAPSAVSDEEDKEIQRIQQLIQDSPDLINAAGGDGTPLVKAAYHGWLKVAGYLLDHGADVNGGGSHVDWTRELSETGNASPLEAAVAAGNKAMTQFLIDRGADVQFKDERGRTVLHLAARHGFQAVTEVLLASHADVNAREAAGQTPLMAAVVGNHIKIIQLLRAAGADPNLTDNQGNSPLNFAVGTTPALVQAVLAAGTRPNTVNQIGRTPLSYAAERDTAEAVKLMLYAQADPNAGTLDVPLLEAVAIKKVATAELLLQAGANPNIQGTWDRGVFVDGALYSSRVTPLYLAVSAGQLPLVQQLLKYRANPNDTQTTGKPLAYWALKQPDILAALLEAGAKADVVESARGDWTLLDEAIARNNFTAVDLLLKHGAKADRVYQNGNRPLYLAAQYLADENIFDRLLAYQADPNQRNDTGETALEILKRASGPGKAVGDLTDQEQKARHLADWLRQHGALDLLPDWQSITISRPAANFSQRIFYNETNGWNHFSLLELVAVQYNFLPRYQGNRGFPMPGPVLSGRMGGRFPMQLINLDAGGLPFPDLAQVHIHRPDADGKHWQDLTVNVQSRLESTNRPTDVPLQWGDVVEIPECDHPLNQSWQGFSTTEIDGLSRAVARQLQLRVEGGTTNSLALTPETNTPDNAQRLNDCWLYPAIFNSGRLLSSSDLTRIQVTHPNPVTGQTNVWTVNCSDPNQVPYFWLRDGDVITVPQK